MIQRIQSIWLLLVSVLGILSLKTSTFSGHRIKDIIPKPIVFVSGQYNLLLIVTTTAVAIVSFIAIFLYKNRKLQLRVTFFSTLISLLILGLYYWQSQSFVPEESTYNLTALIPLSLPILLLLAARGIWKDEQLVKSADRLR